MRRLVFSALLSSFALLSYAQIEFGLKAGVSSMDLADQSLYAIGTHNTNISLAIEESTYGYHFGVYSRIGLLGIYVEPAILFNSSEVNYKLREEIFDTGIIETSKSEKFQTLDLPLMVGYKLAFLRLQAGPVAHLHLNSVSELTDVEGYSQKFDSATYGYRVGAGLDILKVRLDLTYEGNLSEYGDHINIDGQSYSFGENPARIVATLGYKF